MSDVLLLAANSEPLQVAEASQGTLWEMLEVVEAERTAKKLQRAEQRKLRELEIQEAAYRASLMTCRCGTVYPVLGDHPGMGTSFAGRLRYRCRKCANQYMERYAWEQPDKLFPGDLVLLVPAAKEQPLHQQWHSGFAWSDLESDPLWARLGIVTKVLPDGLCKVRSVARPKVEVVKVFDPDINQTSVKKVGRVQQLKDAPQYHLYDFGTFLYAEMIRQGRSGFSVGLLPVKRSN